MSGAQRDKPVGAYVSIDQRLYVDLTDVRNARRNADGSVLLAQSGHAVQVEAGPDADALAAIFGLTTAPPAKK